MNALLSNRYVALAFENAMRKGMGEHFDHKFFMPERRPGALRPQEQRYLVELPEDRVLESCIRSNSARSHSPLSMRLNDDTFTTSAHRLKHNCQAERDLFAEVDRNTPNPQFLTCTLLTCPRCVHFA